MQKITPQFQALQQSRLFGNVATARGFTMIELSVTLIIAGILVVVAVPSLKQTLAGNRLTTLTNRLVSSIHFARSEAVTRNDSVIICSNNATATNWSDGWAVKAGDKCASGELLKAVNSTDAALAVSGVREIIFKGDGTATVPDSLAQTADFELVNASFTRQVVVNRSGHISTKSVAKASLVKADNDE